MLPLAINVGARAAQVFFPKQAAAATQFAYKTVGALLGASAGVALHGPVNNFLTRGENTTQPHLSVGNRPPPKVKLTELPVTRPPFGDNDLVGYGGKDVDFSAADLKGTHALNEQTFSRRIDGYRAVDPILVTVPQLVPTGPTAKDFFYLKEDSAAEVNQNKGAMPKDDSALTSINRPVLLIADKRYANFEETMRKGWGVLDTRRELPYGFGDQVLREVKASGAIEPGQVVTVNNFQNKKQTWSLPGTIALSDPTIDVFKNWANVILESSQAFVPDHESRIKTLHLGWNFATWELRDGKKLGAHVDEDYFLIASTNILDGQSTWIHPGESVPEQERHRSSDITYFDNDEFSNLLIAPNRMTPIWSGGLRKDFDPMVHSSPLAELPAGDNRITPILTVGSLK